MFAGIAYTLIIINLADEMYSASRAGISLLYIYQSFTASIPWKDCDFSGATEKCVPMYPSNVPKNCSMFVYASIEYLQ